MRTEIGTELFGGHLELTWNIVLVQRKYSSELEALGDHIDRLMHLLGTYCHRTRPDLAHP